ncbi:hypothetical protein [Variovorax sp.]|jgi:hypothetical protein|uniref:hypothetical protein n=1 Tax=Variovorax sp. TaxID=1871043 RepID=UPI0037DA5012
MKTLKLLRQHSFTADEAVYGHEVLNLDAVSDPDPSGPLGMVVFCVLQLEDGTVVSGEYHFEGPAAFDFVAGKELAFANALENAQGRDIQVQMG